MPTVAVHAPELSGTTGMFLFLRGATDGVLLNAGGDALTEAPASSGRFTCTVAETISVIHSARIYEGSAETAATILRDGWVAASGTLVEDGFSSTAITELGVATDRLGYLLATEAGACANPQTAAELYAITLSGSTFTVTMAGLTSTGVRTAPSLVKT